MVIFKIKDDKIWGLPANGLVVQSRLLSKFETSNKQVKYEFNVLYAIFKLLVAAVY